MKKSPVFSVIIPAYNNRHTLEQALTSVLRQTYPPQEILVIDDGSTDGTADFVEGSFGKDVRLIRFRENKGPAAARNAGIDLATGTHLAFLDADDSWHPEKLERMKDVLEAYPDAFLVFHDRTLQLEIPGNSSAYRYPFWKLLLRNPVATPCAVVPQSLLRFNESLRWMEDYDFFLRHAEAGPVYYLPERLTVLGRPILSVGGQSSHRWEMRKAEGKVLLLLSKRRPAFWSFSPLGILWLLAKHGLQETKRFFRKS